MKSEGYLDWKASDDFDIIDFISKGTKGDIRKRILISPTEIEDLYTLSFGDSIENDEIDITIVSNNGDCEKI